MSAHTWECVKYGLSVATACILIAFVLFDGVWAVITFTDKHPKARLPIAVSFIFLIIATMATLECAGILK